MVSFVIVYLSFIHTKYLFTFDIEFKSLSVAG
jgi:hypothetical protein